MSFNPEQHLRSLKGNHYLDVKWRLMWLREEHPHARISTEMVRLDTEQKLAVFKAEVSIPDKGSATGFGSETERDFPQGWVEKAETKAIGRALAALGFGTQFALELDEGDRVVDSPATAPSKPAQARGSGLKVVDNRPPQDPDEALRATVLASLATSPDAVAKLPKPAQEMTAEELEKTLSWLRNRAKRAQAIPQQVTPQQVTPQQASEPATQPAQEGPAPDPFSQARDLRADVAVRLANATPADLDQLAAEAVTSVEGDAVSQAKAQEILDCVEFAERVLKAPSAGKLAQVEIDVAAARTAIKIGEDHRDALIALARRVRTQRGWATGEPASASASASAGATRAADANVAEGLAPTDAELAAVAL